MTWTEYVAQVPGANGLFIKLQVRNDEPNIAGNNTVVHYKAIVYNTSTAQWWNQLSETPMRISLNGVDILNVQNGNYDVRGQGRSQTIREGSVTVAHNSDGTKQMAFLWSFDPRSTWHSISGPATVQGNYALPAIPRTSKPTLSKSSFYFGETVTVNTNRVNNAFTHEVAYVINGATRAINANVSTSTTFSVPFSDVPANADSLQIQVKVTTKHGSTVLGTEVINATVSLHPDVKPSLSSILIQDTAQSVMDVFSSGSDFIRGVSKLRVTAVGETTRYGAPIKEYLYRIKDKTDVNIRTTNRSEVLSPLQFPHQGIERVKLQMAVVDSRGRQSAWIDSREIRIHYYTAPRIGTILPKRTGGGTTITVNRNWSVSSLVQNGATTEKNTANLKFYTRQTGSSQWYENAGARSTALSGMDSLANLSGTFAGNQAYEIKAVLTDRFSTVESAPIAVGTETLPITWCRDKTAVGGIVDKSGAPLQVHGDVDVKSGGRLKFDGVPLPILTDLDGTSKEATGDWNNYKESGYYWGRRLANAPAGWTHEWIHVTVIKYDNYHSIQWATDFNGNMMAVRSYASGSWRAWNAILNQNTLPGGLLSFARPYAKQSGSTDCNSIENDVIYVWGGARNKPVDGMLFSFKINDNLIHQTLFGLDNKVYIRSRSNSSARIWGAWVTR